MLSINDVERMTAQEIIRRALLLKDFDISITDTEEMLQLKYINFHYATLNEKDFLDEFGVFSSYWLKSRETLKYELEEQCLFFPDATKLELIKLSIFVSGDDRVTKYLDLAHDTFLSLLSWQGMTNRLIQEIYNNYHGERTEELILTLESFGFEFVLNQKLVNDILYKIYLFSERKERITIRCTCKYLSGQQMNLPIPRCEIANPIYIKPGEYNYIREIETRIRDLRVEPYVIKAIICNKPEVLWDNRKQIVCTSKFPELVEYALGNDQCLLRLIQGYRNIYDNSRTVWQIGQQNTLKKLREILKYNLSVYNILP